MHIKNKLIFLSSFLTIFLIGMFFCSHRVSAATISFSPSVGNYTTGETIRIKVLANSSTSINAISAKISFPRDILELTSISKAGSVINLWAQEPSYSNSSGTANFEGVILSGYSGNVGTAITLIFRAKNPGTASLKFETASILANDGNGTEILSGRGVSTLNIAKSKVQEKETVSNQNVEKDTVIRIEEIKSGRDGQKKFLITSPQTIKDQEYIIAIDSMDVISWVDDGTHIYQAPELSRGTHLIKITAEGVSGDKLSGFIEFSTTNVSTPIITDYPTNIFANEFLVLKGTADSLTDITISITDIEKSETVIGHIQANNTGKFTFVSDEKMMAGKYSITAKATTKDGIESATSNPLEIEVKLNIFNNVLSKISKYMTIVTPVIALGILLLFVMVYGLYHLKRFRIFLKKKLTNAETLVSRSFELLEEDVDKEMALLRKIKTNKPLTDSEKSFLLRLKKDIEAAEKVILKEVKNIEKKK